MPAPERAPQTLYDKVLQAHIVDEKLDGTILLYIGSCLPLRNMARRLALPTHRCADFFQIATLSMK